MSPLQHRQRYCLLGFEQILIGQIVTETGTNTRQSRFYGRKNYPHTFTCVLVCYS